MSVYGAWVALRVVIAQAVDVASKIVCAGRPADHIHQWACVVVPVATISQHQRRVGGSQHNFDP